jgi:hypothetical protein
LRYLYLALFEARPISPLDHNVLVDSLLLVFIVIPLFIISLRFWTSPVYLNYQLKMNSFAAPLALLVCFGGTHTDIILLGVLVGFANFYVFWYHIDPPANIYQMSRHRIKDKRVAKKVYRQQERRANLHGY